ncbi:25167_t:CDS:2 [Dentiscutata erythropus]|uniref:25167_t:CDS:1 n=1 Tax=Dentiscutata erythropus TaxID=1348616 RepID=A0A9N9AYS8_9GLOM|nr:25167_t:CDS:2 [Dentiscutata erythropus]
MFGSTSSFFFCIVESILIFILLAIQSKSVKSMSVASTMVTVGLIMCKNPDTFMVQKLYSHVSTPK